MWCAEFTRGALPELSVRKINLTQCLTLQGSLGVCPVQVNQTLKREGENQQKPSPFTDPEMQGRRGPRGAECFPEGVRRSPQGLDREAPGVGGWGCHMQYFSLA